MFDSLWSPSLFAPFSFLTPLSDIWFTRAGISKSHDLFRICWSLSGSSTSRLGTMSRQTSFGFLNYTLCPPLLLPSPLPCIIVLSFLTAVLFANERKKKEAQTNQNWQPSSVQMNESAGLMVGNLTLHPMNSFKVFPCFFPHCLCISQLVFLQVLGHLSTCSGGVYFFYYLFLIFLFSGAGSSVLFHSFSFKKNVLEGGFPQSSLWSLKWMYLKSKP